MDFRTSHEARGLIPWFPPESVGWLGEPLARLLLDDALSLTCTADGLLAEILEAMTAWQKFGRVCIDPTHLPFGESGIALRHGAMRIIDGASPVAQQAFLSGLGFHDFPPYPKGPFSVPHEFHKNKSPSFLGLPV